MEIKANEINSSKLIGVWNTQFPDLFRELFDNIKKDLDNLDNMIKTNDQKLRIIERLNPNLDVIVSLHDVITNTICKNTALHEFVSYILRDLGLAKKIPYLICVKDSLETFPIITTLKSVFVGEDTFPHVNDLLDLYSYDVKDDDGTDKRLHNFYIIFIPPSILQRKVYWSLIVHEIGHIVTDYYNLIEPFHPAVPPAYAELSIGRSYFHSREYISDYIANNYLGPVFYESLYEYVYHFKIKPRGTHPSWEARLYFLQERLPINEKKIVATIPPENHTTIDKIGDMVLATLSSAFSPTGSIYTLDNKKLDDAKKSLEQMMPVIDSPRITLNAYKKYRIEILSHINSLKKDKESTAVLENKVGHIIEDSIRLSNMQRTFKIMATVPSVS